MGKMNIHFFSILKGARLYLWPPIILNSVVMTVCLNKGGLKGLFLGYSLCLITSFGFLINDLCDRKVDYYNAAGKLETANRQTTSFAFFIAMILLAIGIIIGMEVQERVGVFLAIIVGGLVFYSLIARRLLLLSNLLAAFLGVSPLWGPLLIFRDYDMFHLLTIVSMYLLFVAREMFLDLKDRIGDKRGGRDTVATIFGVRVTSFAAFFLIVFGGIVEVLTINSISGTNQNSKLFLYFITFVVILMLLIPAISILKLGPSKRSMRVLVVSSGISMFFVPLLLLVQHLFRSI